MKYRFLLILPLALLVGCAGSGVKHLGSSSLQPDPAKLNSGIPSVEILEVRSTRDPFGIELLTFVIAQYDGKGGFKVDLASQGGDGFFHAMAPGTPGAIGFWAGMEAFDVEGDETNIENNGGDIDNSNSNEGDENNIDNSSGDITNTNSNTNRNFNRNQNTNRNTNTNRNVVNPPRRNKPGLQNEGLSPASVPKRLPKEDPQPIRRSKPIGD